MLFRPFISEIPCASWNECTLILQLLSMALNSSWMLFNTSALTLSVCTRRLFESCRPNFTRFDAIFLQPAYLLSQCGVPRKTISLIRLRTVFDLWSVCIDVSATAADRIVLVNPYIFQDDPTEAMRDEYNRILVLSQYTQMASIGDTSLSISLFNLTAKS